MADYRDNLARFEFAQATRRKYPLDGFAAFREYLVPCRETSFEASKSSHKTAVTRSSREDDVDEIVERISRISVSRIAVCFLQPVGDPPNLIFCGRVRTGFGIRIP